MIRLPTLRPREVIGALKKIGFAERRQSGSHLILVHPDGRRVVIPIHANDLPRETMHAIIKQAGLTEEEIRALI
jgi:predicted RNA binding protein YcfA (HicA-like mRNA interferase family)